jgi:hypothetical protein
LIDCKTEIYIKKQTVPRFFADQLRENLKLDAGFTLQVNAQSELLTSEIESLEIYNQEELPAITP